MQKEIAYSSNSHRMRPSLLTRLLTGSLLLGTLSVTTGAQAAIDLKANQQPVHAPKNAEAIAQIPTDFTFVTQGKLTVAIAALGSSPPLAFLADDNKTVVGSEPDIARLVADSLGLELNIVPTHGKTGRSAWPPVSMMPPSSTLPSPKRARKSSISPPTASTRSAST